jgi:hypothetical protein
LSLLSSTNISLKGHAESLKGVCSCPQWKICSWQSLYWPFSLQLYLSSLAYSILFSFLQPFIFFYSDVLFDMLCVLLCVWIICVCIQVYLMHWHICPCALLQMHSSQNASQPILSLEMYVTFNNKLYYIGPPLYASVIWLKHSRPKVVPERLKWSELKAYMHKPSCPDNSLYVYVGCFMQILCCRGIFYRCGFLFWSPCLKESMSNV